MSNISLYPIVIYPRSFTQQHFQQPNIRIKEKRTVYVQQSAFGEGIFCFLWGVTKNYIMYWGGVTSIIIA